MAVPSLFNKVDVFIAFINRALETPILGIDATFVHL